MLLKRSSWRSQCITKSRMFPRHDVCDNLKPDNQVRISDLDTADRVDVMKSVSSSLHTPCASNVLEYFLTSLFAVRVCNFLVKTAYNHAFMRSKSSRSLKVPG